MMNTNGTVHVWTCKTCGTEHKPDFSNLDTASRPFKVLCNCHVCKKVTELGPKQ